MICLSLTICATLGDTFDQPMFQDFPCLRIKDLVCWAMFVVPYKNTLCTSRIELLLIWGEVSQGHNDMLTAEVFEPVLP